jgi:uncharacterized membrane protein YfcA
MISWEYIYAALAIFGAGIIRGYSGFGFAMVCAISLSFVFPPSQVTPVILCLDVVASSWLLSKTRKQVDWKGLKYIGFGAVFTLPLGSLALVLVPINSMRIFISIIIICFCVGLLWKKKQESKSTGSMTTIGVGMLSGFLTGVAGIGGPPIILFYFSSNRSVSVSRASMIAFFLVADSLAIISTAFYGLINTQTLTLSCGLVIPLMIGIWTGNFLFGKFSNEAAFRNQVILLLMAISFISLIKFSLPS